MKRSIKLTFIGLLITLVGVAAFFISKSTGSREVEYLTPLVFVGLGTFIFSRFLD